MTRTIKQQKDVKDSVKTASAYIRVSTIQQAREGVSLDVQKKKIIEYSDDPKNMLILDPNRIYVDEGKSAYKNLEKRTGYKQAIEDIKTGRTEVLLVYSLSRAFRSVKECIIIKEMLEKTNRDLISITESSINTRTEIGKVFFQMMGIFSEFESGQTAKRVRDTMLESFENKGFNGSAKPCGYVLHKTMVEIRKKQKVWMEPRVTAPFYDKENNGERKIVEEIFRLYRTQWSQNRIADKYGMSRSVVSHILSNPLFAGYLLWVTKDGRHKLIQGTHEAYITREQYNRNVDKRLRNVRNGKLSRNPPYKIRLDKEGKPYLDFVKPKIK